MLSSNRNQHGISLLEIMVAASLLGLLAVGGSKLMNNQLKGQKTVEARSEITSLINDMRNLLSKERSCEITFGGQNINMSEGVVSVLRYQEYFAPGTPAPPIVPRYQSNSNPQLGNVYGNGNIRILGYSLSASSDTTDPAVGAWSRLPSPSSNQVGVINLRVRFFVGKNKALGSENVTKKIKLNVEIDSANRIVRCSASEGFGIDGRYLQRISTDDGYRTMQGNLIIADPYEIVFSSDESLKYNIKELSQVLPQVRKLRPVSYKWKSNDQTSRGLIAQEVQSIYPDLVSMSNSTETLSVNYIQLIPILIRGIQETDEENKKLKKQLVELQIKQSIMMKDFCKKDSSLSFCKR